MNNSFISISDINSPEFKIKLLSQELLSNILEFFINFPKFQRELIFKIKEPLCDTLLKNCICQEKQIFSLSFRTFSILLWNYKEYIKAEIVLFIEQIFLKILISENSSVSHRYSSIQVLTKIISSPKILLEFFVNYDCDIGYFNVIEKTIEIFGKISQGKYLKSEYSFVIQPEKENQLRNLALEGLAFMINSLDKFLEDSENQSSLIRDDGKNESTINNEIQEQNSSFSELNETSSSNILDHEKLFKFFKKRK